jgi:hypothetical protein
MNVVGTVDADSLNIAGVSTFVGDVTFDGNTAGYDVVWDRSDNALEFADNAYLKIGTGSDLNLYHDASNSYITHNGSGNLIVKTTGTNEDLYIQAARDIYLQPKANEEGIKVIGDGAVQLYNNNVLTFETVSNGVKVTGTEGADAYLYISADEGDDNADQWRLKADTSGMLGVDSYTSGSWVTKFRIKESGEVQIPNDSGKYECGSSGDLKIYHDGSTNIIDGAYHPIEIRHGAEVHIKCVDDGTVELYHNNSKKLETSSSGVTVTGTVSDSKGDLRKIIQNSTTGSYTLVVADAGKHVLATGTVTIPNSTFAAGDAVTIINNSGSDITLTASVGTLYNTADASTGNRTLAGRGMATILFSSATVAYISGAGLS